MSEGTGEATAAAPTRPVTSRLRRLAEITLLSIFWRRSGNLAVPGATHAFIDSMRNAFGNIP